MQRFLSTSFILLALALGTVSAAPTAYAADCLSGYITDINGDSVNADGSSCTVGASSGTAVNANTASGTGSNCLASQQDADGNCLPGTDPATAKAQAESPTQYQGNPDAGFGGVMAWVMSLFAWLVGVAAITLDNAVYYTVVTMGDYVSKLTAVGVSWRILRDIGNILLIFGFLAVGITTILNDEISYGTGKKMLPMMLAAAVFLNFSLFITETIVDTGNLFATQFYTQINGGKPAQPTGYSIDLGVTALGKGQVSSEPISNAIMGRLGLQTLYNVPVNKDIFAAGNTWIIGFMGILLFLTTAFVMFSLAFILIARFVALIFLIIVAPIGFAGLAIPGFAARAKEYWTTLFEQTITAPILLLMLYIALAIITDANFLTGLCVSTDPANKTCTPNAVGWVSGNFQGFAGFILSFLVAIAALLLVIVYAKRWSAFGGDFASRMGAKLTFGATAWATQRTVGRGAYLASRGLRQNQTFNKLNAMTGRALSGTLDRVATGSFDVRSTDVLKRIPFGSNIDMGAGQKGGFTEARKQNIKEHEGEAKRIEEAHKEALKNTAADEKEIAEAAEKHREATKAKTDAQTAKDAAQKAKQEAEASQSADKIEHDRLAAIGAADRNAGRPSSVGDALRAAEQKLKTSDADFKTASENLTKAAKNLTTATEAETAAEKAKTTAEGAAEKRMKDSITANKIAYAEGIDHLLNPITFVAYGPDTAAAARKIKSSLKEKPTKDKFLEMAKKLAKETEEKEGEGKEEPPKTETKPEGTK